MRRYKLVLLVLILFLGIGFASVSTTLRIDAGAELSKNNEDFDVRFTRAVMDGIDITSTSISNDGKSISFGTKELLTSGDNSVLEYIVTNNSSMYDAAISINCVSNDDYSSSYSLVNSVDSQVAAKTGKTGVITVTLNSTQSNAIQGALTCTLIATPVERTTIGESYRVTFNPNGGVVDTTSKEVLYGSTYGELPTPTREGYTFKGWNGKNLFDIENIQVGGMSKIVNNNEIILDGSEVADNFATDVRIQNLKSNSFISNFKIFDTQINRKTFTFLKNDTFDTLYFRQNTSKRDPGFGTNDIHYANNKYYTVSFDLSYYNFEECKSIIENLQIEEGDTATEYEPYYVTSNTKVTQEKNHTLTAIWQEN